MLVYIRTEAQLHRLLVQELVLDQGIQYLFPSLLNFLLQLLTAIFGLELLENALPPFAG